MPNVLFELRIKGSKFNAARTLASIKTKLFVKALVLTECRSVVDQSDDQNPRISFL